MIDFTPTQVFLDAIPFVGTFDHLEAEVTAAVIVKALAINGDKWRVIECSELAEVFGQLTAQKGMWRSLFNNPFVKVDMHDLVNRGFAKWCADSNGNEGKAIEFTEAGLLRMAKWQLRE